MKNTNNISIRIAIFLFIASVMFFIIALFWYGNFNSIREFLDNFFTEKNIGLLVFIALFCYIIWFSSKFFIRNIFDKIEENNKKLKDYNHFLAHELKTPISVINSNLEVLEYGFDIEKINNSKLELQNMTKIIDWLLSFSESFNALEKIEINVENFIKKFISFKDYEENIKIINKQFNFSILTDELLFERIIKNLIENALKYSPDKKLNIYIKTDRLIFENNLYKDFSNEDLEKINERSYSKTYNENVWSWLWLSMIEEIVKVLWYSMYITSKEDKFTVQICYVK